MNHWTALRAAAGLLLTLSLAVTTQQAGAAEKKEKEQPSFKPGADVILSITLDSPQDWHLNENVPIVFNFDEDEIKGVPVAIEKTKWEFKLESSTERIVAQIPVKLSSKAPEGTVSIPLNVTCSICTEETGSCAFSTEGFKVKVKVEAKPTGDPKNSALAKGLSPVHYRLSAPF